MKRLLPTAILCITAIVLAACGENSSGPEQPEMITEEQAVDATAETMRNRGLTVQSGINKTGSENVSVFGLTLLDYITTELAKDGDRQVRLLIGPDGSIIPGGAWRDANPNVCEDQNRFLKGAQKVLNFKLNAVEDGYIVFIQFIDVETGKIEEQREGEGAGLVEAIGKAWDKLQTPISKPTGPCGQKKGLTFIIHSETTFESTSGDGLKKSDEVRAEFTISYNEQDNIYEGSGKLEWSEFSITSGAAAFKCDRPEAADLKVRSFTSTNDEDTANETKAIIQYLNWKEASCSITADGNTVNGMLNSGFAELWQILHINEIAESIIRDPGNGVITNESKYEIQDWEAPENGDIIARKTYDRSQTVTDDKGAVTTFTEQTTIEVHGQ